MKRLTLIRHAKSSWKDAEMDDIDRPLSNRGKVDAPAMGAHLHARGLRPDQMVTSPAKRAAATARHIAAALEYPKQKIATNPMIYEADVPALMRVIRELDAGAHHVILVGHNPGFTDLANHLADAGIENIPTCGVVDIELAVKTWTEVAAGSGTVRYFEHPKTLSG